LVSIYFLFTGVSVMFLSSLLGSCSFSKFVILNVCGDPAFLRNVDTTAAASAFSLAI
jgi:hypothetical protein